MPFKVADKKLFEGLKKSKKSGLNLELKIINL